MLRRRTEDRITTEEISVGMGLLQKFNFNALGFVCYLVGQNSSTSCGENLN